MDSKRILVFKHFVEDLAELSKCTDKKVATIITDKEGTQVYSIGINGGPKGGADCLCELGGKYTCVHAEANAIAKCTVNDPEKVFFCTLSPCVTCAAMIINAGAHAVYYIESYHDTTGIEQLRNAGIHVVCITDPMLTQALEKINKKERMLFNLQDKRSEALFQECLAYLKSAGIPYKVHFISGIEDMPKLAEVQKVE